MYITVSYLNRAGRVTREAKIAYAKSVAGGEDPVRVALTYVENDPVRALRLVEELSNDPIVIDILSTTSSVDKLPQRDDLLKSVWGLAEDYQYNAEDRLKAYRLYAEIMKFLDKTPQVAIQNNRVMIVKEFDDWEETARLQQAKLIGKG